MTQFRWSLALAAVMCIALMGAQGGCGGAVCDFNGKIYQSGDSFPAGDGCNKCTCTDSGQTSCTRKACINQCGGTTQVRCADGDYCHYDTGCGTKTAGLCKKKPETCNTAYNPVCGCDDKTYGNACAASAAGVSVKSKGKCAGGSAQDCEHKGKTHKDGDTFQDDCNSCKCEKGKISCTTKACTKSCKYNGKEYKEGDTYPATDGCNTCTCTDGQSACTKKGCPPAGCQYNGKAYKEGDSFPATDGCNTCTCTNGSVSCTKKNCPPTGCTHQGKTYKDGDTFPAGDGCNTCTCNAGQVGCTKKACPPAGCKYDGKTYKEGDSFPATDGCNTCTCQKGQVGCTEKVCPKTCSYNGKTYKEGDSFPATDGCNTCTCQGGQVGCTKKACVQSCGSRGLKPCPTDKYCNQPGHCGATDIPGSCQTKPTRCTKEYRPVCGCDNKTYSNACGAAAAGVSVKSQGACKTTSKSCTYNGKTYPHGTSFKSTDGCNTCSCSNGQVACTKKACVQSCGSRGLKPCSTDKYCKQPGHCGATDIPGTCEIKPSACNRLFKPVCGCDNKTYSNECVAASNGVSVKAQGQCKTSP